MTHLHYLTRLPFYIFSIWTFLSGCDDTESSYKVSISLQTTQQGDSVFSILLTDPVNYEHTTLGESTLDFTGKGTVQLDLQTPTFASLQLGERLYKIYLEPGRQLDISLPDGEQNAEPHFSGSGANANNYLTGQGQILQNFYRDRGNFSVMEPQEFAAVLDTLSLQYQQFHEDFMDSTDLQADFSQMMHANNLLNVIFLKQQYQIMNQERLTFSQEEVPESLSQFSKDIPLDMAYLDWQMPVYAEVLTLYARSVTEELWKDAKANTALEQLPVVAYKKMEEVDLPEGIRSYLLAKRIYEWLAEQGLTPGLDTIYHAYQQRFGHTAYFAPLKKQYEEWMDLTAGHDAPAISGVTPDGKKVTLNDLKGKVVYIDIWATWCGPCREEFPYYPPIQEVFDDEEDVAFLFVSIDQEKDKWARFVEEKNGPKGIQIHEEVSEGHPDIRQSYKIWGIPRYILIDQEGKIVDVNAARPSSGEVEQEIKALL